MRRNSSSTVWERYTNLVGLSGNVVRIDYAVRPFPSPPRPNASDARTLLADHLGILVITVVGVPQLARGLNLKLHELVSKLARVPHVVPKVKVVVAAAHGFVLCDEGGMRRMVGVWEVSLGGVSL